MKNSLNDIWIRIPDMTSPIADPIFEKKKSMPVPMLELSFSIETRLAKIAGLTNAVPKEKSRLKNRILYKFSARLENKKYEQAHNINPNVKNMFRLDSFSR